MGDPLEFNLESVSSVPKAIYAHCFAHRLNLVIVDVVHNTTRADDFFTLLQSLHNLFSSPIVQELYIKAQRFLFPDSQPREIPSLSDTRWVCRHDACETLLATLSAEIDVIEDLMDVSSEHDATERSMMVQLNTSFVIYLCIFNFLLKICADASANSKGRVRLWIRHYKQSRQCAHGCKGLRLH